MRLIALGTWVRRKADAKMYRVAEIHNDPDAPTREASIVYTLKDNTGHFTSRIAGPALEPLEVKLLPYGTTVVLRDSFYLDSYAKITGYELVPRGFAYRLRLYADNHYLPGLWTPDSFEVVEKDGDS